MGILPVSISKRSTPWFLISDFLTDRRSSILGVWAVPGDLGTFRKGGGLRPPTFLEGFLAARGRPDPQHRRFPVGQKIIFQNIGVKSLSLQSKEFSGFCLGRKIEVLGSFLVHIGPGRVWKRLAARAPLDVHRFPARQTTSEAISCGHKGFVFFEVGKCRLRVFVSGPNRPREGLEKAPGSSPARCPPIFSPADQFQGRVMRFFEQTL